MSELYMKNWLKTGPLTNSLSFKTKMNTSLALHVFHMADCTKLYTKKNNDTYMCLHIFFTSLHIYAAVQKSIAHRLTIFTSDTNNRKKEECEIYKPTFHGRL